MTLLFSSLSLRPIDSTARYAKIFKALLDPVTLQSSAYVQCQECGKLLKKTRNTWGALTRHFEKHENRRALTAFKLPSTSQSNSTPQNTNSPFTPLQKVTTTLTPSTSTLQTTTTQNSTMTPSSDVTREEMSEYEIFFEKWMRRQRADKSTHLKKRKQIRFEQRKQPRELLKELYKL